MIINRQSEQILTQQFIPKPTTTRLKSVDVYRGLTMLGMILVDNQGSVPIWVFNQSDWDGLSTADLIFPAFLFIMGFAIPLAVKSPYKILRLLIRVCGLFFIGVFLNFINKKFDFTLLRIMGVLQRISICYLIVVLIHIATNYAEPKLRKFGAGFVAILGLVYLGLMVSFTNPVDGCDKNNNLEPYCNFCRSFDSKILTLAHMLKPTDPEGLFSTLSALVTVYGGYYFCLIMKDTLKNRLRLLKYWACIALLTIFISIPLSFIMPYNKKLWSSSFSVLVIGISGGFLTLITLLVDQIPEKSLSAGKIIDIITRPFIWLGMNPLAIFVLMDLFAIIMIRYVKLGGTTGWHYIYLHWFASWISNKQWCSAVFSIFITIIWILVAFIMHRFKIFIKL